MTVPRRIHRLIEGRQLEQVEPDPQRIVGLWQKALASDLDSRKGLSADNSVSLAYQAAFQASSAVLEAAGFRTRGQTTGHHHDTFYALSDLPYPGLAEVHGDSERIRKMRTDAFYGAGAATPQQVAAVHQWVEGLLSACWAALTTVRPDLRAQLAPPSG
jgi:hypothetical protein